jgi:transaldolase
VIKKLVEQQIRLNITLVFSLVQSLMMCKFEVEYISPFIGRLDDIGVQGVHQLQQICTMVKMREFYTQVLAASIRSPEHFHDAIMAGADAITVPLDVLEKSIGHPLTDKGIDIFLADWQKLGIRQFP